MKVATTRAKLHIIRHKSIQVVAEGIGLENYRKIPKISPGAYIFKALFDGLIFGGAYFGGAYLRREICVSKSIGLAV